MNTAPKSSVPELAALAAAYGGWSKLAAAVRLNRGTLAHMAAGRRPLTTPVLAALKAAGLTPAVERRREAGRRVLTAGRRARRRRQAARSTNRRISRARDLFAIPTKVLAQLFDGRREV